MLLTVLDPYDGVSLKPKGRVWASRPIGFLAQYGAEQDRLFEFVD